MSKKKANEKMEKINQLEINKKCKRLEYKNKYLISLNYDLKRERDHYQETCYNHEANIKKFEAGIERVNQNLIDSIGLCKKQKKEFEGQLSKERQKFREAFEKFLQENLSLKNELKSKDKKLENICCHLKFSENMLEKAHTEQKLKFLENEQLKSKIEAADSKSNLSNDLVQECRVEIGELKRNLAAREKNQKENEIKLFKQRLLEESEMKAIKEIQDESFKEKKLLETYIVDLNSKLCKSEDIVQELKAQIEHINVSNTKEKNDLITSYNDLKKKYADQSAYSEYLAKILSDQTEAILKQKNLAAEILNLSKKKIKEENVDDLERQ